jgi:GNAT superfamily N-acetyltransferase
MSEIAELTFTIVEPARLDHDDVFRLYETSGLAERRPIHEPGRLRRMLDGSNLIAVASDGSGLVGIARSISDFSYVTYLADLAVAGSWQRRGIGRRLIEVTRAAAPKAKIVLLAAPKAATYYPRVGFSRHDSAWTLPALEG